MASEVRTRTTHTRAHTRLVPAKRARVVRWRVYARATCTCLERYLSIHSYRTLFAGISTDLRSLRACSAPPYTQTHARKRSRAHDLGVDSNICVHAMWTRSSRTCMCACDIDGLDTSRALDGTRAHACSYGRSIAMHPYMDSYMHTHTLARTRTSAAPPRTTAAPRPRPTEARPPPDARGPKGGAYIGQRRDGGGVPRADVRVEL